MDENLNCNVKDTESTLSMKNYLLFILMFQQLEKALKMSSACVNLFTNFARSTEYILNCHMHNEVPK